MQLPYTLSYADLQDQAEYRLNELLILICDQINSSNIGPANSSANSSNGLAITFSGGSATQGVPYSASFAATGGTTPYLFSILGSPPAGLSLNVVTGTLSGTPSATGTFNFIGQVTDKDGSTAATPVSIVVTATFTPAAPNVTSATVSVSYVQWANAQKVVFSGSFTLPTSDPNYNQDVLVSITAVDPNGKAFPVASISGTPVGSPTTYTNINGSVIQQPVSTQSGWSLVFTCSNTAGNPTASPYTITGITLSSSAVSAVSASEIGPVYQGTDSALRTVVQVTPTCGQLPLQVTIWLDYDDGNGPIWQGWFPFTAAGQSYSFGQPTAANGGEGSIFVPVVPAQTNWTAWAYPGAINSSGAGLAPPAYVPGTAYSQGAVVISSGVLYVSLQSANTGNTPVSSPLFWQAAVSGSFTVAVAQACLPTDCTSIQFLNDPTTGLTMDYAVGSIGQIIWIYYGLEWTQPTLTFDPYFWFAMWTVQLGNLVTGTCTISGGTNLNDGTAPFSAGQVGNVVHVAGVWNTIAAYVNASNVTLTTAATNGSGIAYDVWNPAPVNSTNGSQGTNDDPDLLFYGRQVKETGQAGVTASVFTDFGNIYPGWTYPPAQLPAGGGTNPYRTFKCEVYAVSRLAQNPAGGPQGQTYTRQIGWPSAGSGGTDAGYLIPVSPNPNTLNMATADTSTLDSSVAIIALKLAVANNGITAAKMAANAITAANGAIAANAVVDSNVASVGVSKLISGTVIFTGTVVLSQGSANPVIVLQNTGVFLYGVAASGGGSGLTSSPYIAIQSSGVSVFSGGTGPSVVTTGSSVVLYSVNASTSNPYLSLGSGGLQIINGSYSVTITSAQVVLTNGTNSVTINSSGVTIVNGILTAPNITATGGAFTVTLNTSTGFEVTGNGITTTINNGTFGAYPAGILVSATSSPSTLINNGGLILYSSGGIVLVGILSVSNAGVLSLSSVAGNNLSLLAAPIATSATSGSYTLPANPAGFISVIINSSNYKIPFYNF